MRGRKKTQSFFLSTTEDKTVYGCKEKQMDAVINSFYPIGELYIAAPCNAALTSVEIHIQAHFSSGERLTVQHNFTCYYQYLHSYSMSLYTDMIVADEKHSYLSPSGIVMTSIETSIMD